jgi:hypothetical protein
MAAVKTTLAVALLALGLLIAPTTLADAPPGQGRACSAANKCPAKLQCVARKSAASTCELRCARNADCPQDQRCVKDGETKLCRPVTDEDTDYKRPSF